MVLEDGGSLPPQPHLSQLVDKVSSVLGRFAGVSAEQSWPRGPSMICRMPGLIYSVLHVWPQEYNMYERDINNKDGACGPCLATGHNGGLVCAVSDSCACSVHSHSLV